MTPDDLDRGEAEDRWATQPTAPQPRPQPTHTMPPTWSPRPPLWPPERAAPPQRPTPPPGYGQPAPETIRLWEQAGTARLGPSSTPSYPSFPSYPGLTTQHLRQALDALLRDAEARLQAAYLRQQEAAGWWEQELRRCPLGSHLTPEPKISAHAEATMRTLRAEQVRHATLREVATYLDQTLRQMTGLGLSPSPR